MSILRAILSTFCVALVPVALALPANAQDGEPIVPYMQDIEDARLSAFSGQPVPRFKSLKYATVHGRLGPSLDYPVAWRYERRGLPVLIVKESRDWRMVRDPNGDEVWMHARTLGGDPTVLLFADLPIPVHASADPDSRVIAQAEPGVIASLMTCTDAFCRVFVDGKKGWVSKGSLWGAPGGPAPKKVNMTSEWTLTALE